MTYLFCETLEQAARAVAERLRLKEEYYELVMADLTDDRPCTWSELIARRGRMIELGDLLGPEATNEIRAAADEAALENGFYASGAPYPF